MHVHLIRKQPVAAFVLANAPARSLFTNWLAVLKAANWLTPADILATFGSADLLGNGSNRVVFNVGGNAYRVICHYVFGAQQVHLFIRWLGTHAGYTRLCAQGRPGPAVHDLIFFPDEPAQIHRHPQ